MSFLSFPCPIFLSLVHFLLLVYIFPIFHGVISFFPMPYLQFPCNVNISCLSQSHFFSFLAVQIFSVLQSVILSFHCSCKYSRTFTLSFRPFPYNLNSLYSFYFFFTFHPFTCKYPPSFTMSFLSFSCNVYNPPLTHSFPVIGCNR